MRTADRKKSNAVLFALEDREKEEDEAEDEEGGK